MGIGEAYRAVYGEYIITKAMVKENAQSLFIMYLRLGSGKKIIEERVRLIMKKGKSKKGWNVVLTIVSGVWILGAASLSVYAYEKPTVMTSIDYENRDSRSPFVEKYGIVEGKGNPLGLPDYDFSVEDAVFVDEEGNSYAIANGGRGKVACAHKWGEGEYSIHNKLDTGCIVTIYKAKMCSKCNAITDRIEINKLTYEVCIH